MPANPNTFYRSTTATSSGTDQNSGEEPSNREMQLVQAISDRLETGLNEYALRAIMDLLKRGEHPDAIVAVVTSLAQRPGGP